MNHYPSFQIGGPVIKDRMLVLHELCAADLATRRGRPSYYSDESADRASRQPRKPTTARPRSDYFQGRLDASPHNTLRVTGTYIWNPYQEDGVFPTAAICLGGSIPSVTSVGRWHLTGNDVDREAGRPPERDQRLHAGDLDTEQQRLRPVSVSRGAS